MEFMNNSKRGTSFESILVTDLVRTFGGRAATTEENITEQFDYELNGQRVDIKWQPKAYKHGTVNFELYEYSSEDPSVTHQSWYYTGTADTYFWYVGQGKTLCISKEEVKPYVDALVNPGKNMKLDMKLKMAKGRISTKNGNVAKAMSRQHGSSKWDNAVTALMPIKILESLPSTTVLRTTDHGRID